jgi:hypothetical protein
VLRQTDAVGNVSDIGKNTLRIVVDNTDPTFDLQPKIINSNQAIIGNAIVI